MNNQQPMTPGSTTRVLEPALHPELATAGSSTMMMNLIAGAVLQGYVKCDKCRGTGYRAGWLEQGYQP